MADAAVERDHSKAAERDRVRRLRRSIVREWMRAGYRRSQHVAGIRAEGDQDILVDWREAETATARRSMQPPFATWLAAQDMWEIHSAIWAQRARC